MDPTDTLETLICNRGLPLGELAQRAGISARTLWLLRNGRLASIRITTLSGLASALKVKPARLKSILDLPLR